VSRRDATRVGFGELLHLDGTRPHHGAGGAAPSFSNVSSAAFDVVSRNDGQVQTRSTSNVHLFDIGHCGPRYEPANFELRVLVASANCTLTGLQPPECVGENVIVTQTRVRIPLGPPK
jgi:hypothetical protein